MRRSGTLISAAAGLTLLASLAATLTHAAAQAAHPAALPAPTLTEAGLIDATVVFLTALATTVAIFPVAVYVLFSWKWREHVIFTSLTAQAKDSYLHLYHREDRDAASAAARFARFYGKWFGQSRLIVPTIIITVIVAFYAFILSSYAAEWIFGSSIIYIVPPDVMSADSTGMVHSISIAIAAIAGAYTMVSLEAISRVIQRDLSAEDLYLYALRLIACVPMGYALSSLVKNDAAMIVAFSVGAFPLQVLASLLRRNVTKQLGDADPEDVKSDLITRLDGVDAAIFERVGNIGVTTIGQLAESDPVQLTMRTNLTFCYLLDLVSQSLAWIYLGDKLATLRPMGLRGACELGVLNAEARNPDDPLNANSLAVITQAAAAIGLTVDFR